MPQRHRVASVGAVPPGTGRAFSVEGRTLAVFNIGGRFLAIDDRCSHDCASLAEGGLEGTTVTCPRHGAEFDVTSGRALCLPAVEDVRSFPVFLNGDMIEVEL